jgi:hypothetical protein
MKRKNAKITIGRKDKVDFPQLGLYDVDAKVDTGAYTSSIHCDKIELIEQGGKKRVGFRLLDPSHRSYNGKKFVLPVYAKRRIKNSFGQVEERYIIKTKILLSGKLLDIELSLSNRFTMGYPVLLGRKFLSEGFIVDVTQTDLLYKQKLRGAKK